MTPADPIPDDVFELANELAKKHWYEGEAYNRHLSACIEAVLADRARNAALVSEAVAGWPTQAMVEAAAGVLAAEIAGRKYIFDRDLTLAEEVLQAAFAARTPTQEKPEGDHNA